MEKRRFGTTDMDVTVLGFGGAEIGFESAAQADVDTLLNSALDLGLNVIDTGECYRDSEEMIGNAVSHRRDEYFLFTKCGHASGFDEPDWDLKMLEKSIDRSLVRLKTDCLDLIQLHSCSEDLLRKGEVIEVLQRARDAGKTRYIGYSGDHKPALYAVECGAFDSLQTSINIADQECIDLTLSKAQASGMGVIAKRPIANVAWRTGIEKPSNGYVLSYWERLQELQYDFTGEGPTEQSVETALRFTLAQPGVSVAIVGTKNPSRWASNAALAGLGPLPPEEVHAIRERWAAVSLPDWVGQN